jgi:chromosome segregation ATPase
VQTIVKEQLELANIEQRKATAREQLGEYKARMDELHAQIVTLKMVKSAGPMMQSLEKKLSETSDKVSKITVQIVELEEQAMVARIKLQDSIAELTMGDDAKKKDEPKKDDKKKDEKAGPAKKA